MGCGTSDTSGTSGTSGNATTRRGTRRRSARARRSAAVAGVHEGAHQPRRGVDGERLARLAREGAEVCDTAEEPDFYNDGDSVVGELERRVADLLGTEAAAYFPTGTMAQQAALRAWAGRTGNPVVALHPLAHPEQHERGALGT